MMVVKHIFINFQQSGNVDKRRKVDAECRAFNKEWENKYFLSKLLKAHRLPVVLLLVLFFNNFGEPRVRFATFLLL